MQVETAPVLGLASRAQILQDERPGENVPRYPLNIQFRAGPPSRPDEHPSGCGVENEQIDENKTDHYRNEPGQRKDTYETRKARLARSWNVEGRAARNPGP